MPEHSVESDALVRLRRWLKRRCLHIWRERHICGPYVECHRCHDRRHAGVWLFRSTGLPR